MMLFMKKKGGKFFFIGGFSGVIINRVFYLLLL